MCKESVMDWLKAKDPKRPIGSITLGEIRELSCSMEPIKRRRRKKAHRKPTRGRAKKNHKPWTRKEERRLKALNESCDGDFKEIGERLGRTERSVYLRVYEMRKIGRI